MTPMMQQYLTAKEQCPGALLLFRMGDFYELFLDDAKTAARILGLTLTSREKGPDAVPMAGFPHHALDGHLRKLIAAGQRVAVCDQVEDPKLAKGLVKREITRIVTPGTLTDDALLDPRASNYLVALAPPAGGETDWGAAWIDAASGGITVASLAESELREELVRLEPAECLFPEELRPDGFWELLAGRPAWTPRPGFMFSSSNAADLLRRHFGVASFDGFGVSDAAAGVRAAGALLAYLLETQKTELKHVSRLVPYERGRFLLIDPMARRSLELTRSLRDNSREGSLLDAVDMTSTAAGSRLLADWLNRPLVDVERIRLRQAAVQEWKDDPHARRELREMLSQTYDLERLAARVSTGRSNPRDLGSLRETLRRLPAVKAKLASRNALLNADLEERLDLAPDLRELLERTLVDDPPIQVREGGVIRTGVHAELDELRDVASGGKQWIASFQKAEAERIGVPSLKVGFNKVFGFYIEISNAHKGKAPPEYQRKQTVKNAERYVTEELKAYEQKVLGAEERSKALEYELFDRLREDVAAQLPRLQGVAAVLAELDVVVALAELASLRNYCRPRVEDSDELTIVGGRHPVLDVSMPPGRFVPNDVRLGGGAGRFLLITGPNMAGKSTYIRQVALIVILAQIGGFTPAESAVVGVADRLFARVGASDELSRGQSTFMVEMTEAANILNNATPRSLVVLDEIGRGTSTYDGVSLAWAVAEHLHDVVKCRTLFATHYHELIELERSLPGLRNLNVAVREWKDEIVFLHQIVEGGADRSYGIHVARLAGVPKSVLRRAQEVLEHLERDPFGESRRFDRPHKRRRTYHQLSLFPSGPEHPVLDEIRALDAASMDPEKLAQLVAEWKEKICRADGA